MDVVNYEMPLMGKAEHNFLTDSSECDDNFIIRKSILSYKAYDREVNNVQKMIATLRIDTNNKKIILSKSAKKRLRKKRQASAKQNIQKSLSNGIIQEIGANVTQVHQRESLNPLQNTKQHKNNINIKELEQSKQNSDPQHSIFSFIVSGSCKKLSTEDIMLLLGLQNSFLTDQWVVKQRKHISTNKSMITVGIDPNSESLLKNNCHQASLLRSTIVFKKKNKDTIVSNNNNNASKQPEDKPFSWLGKWQTFTTNLNRIH